MPGAFDGLREQALVRRAYAADSPGKDLPPFGDEMPEELGVFEVDIGDFFGAEFAHPLAPDTEPSWTWHNEWPFYRSGPDILSPVPVKFLHI